MIPAHLDGGGLIAHGHLGEVGPKQNEFVAAALSVGNTYDFRVGAFNESGTSYSIETASTTVQYVGDVTSVLWSGNAAEADGYLDYFSPAFVAEGRWGNGNRTGTFEVDWLGPH